MKGIAATEASLTLVRSRARGLAALLVALAMGCTSVPIPPTPTSVPTPAASPSTAASPTSPPTGPPPTSTPSPPQVGPLELDECDPLGYIPCEHQAVALRIPIAGTGVALTYSSEWQPGRLDRPQTWDPSSLGLGGWSLDVLQRYDAANGALLGGDGSWRFAEAVALAEGETAVPSFDGRLAYVFDAAGRHVRTVQAILGVDLVDFTYDGEGRLLTATGSLDSAPIDLTIERAADGTATAVVGAGGALTEAPLDGAGHLAALTHPDGGRSGFITDPSGLIVVDIDPAGGVSRFEYDDSGRLAAATDADGVRTTFQRTASLNGMQVSLAPPLTSPATYRTQLTDTGIKRTYVAPGGATTTVLTLTDGTRTVGFADGTKLTVGAAPDVRWGLAAPLLTPSTTERPDGVVTRVEVSQVVQPTPDDPLRVSAWSRTTTVDGASYVERYDPLRNALIMTDPQGRTTEAVYDERGRTVAYNAPQKPPAAFTYDDQGRLATETNGADTRIYDYGDNGRLTVTRQDGVNESVVVDAHGRVVQQTAGDGSTTLSSYDATGRPILVRPGGAQSTALGYTPAGRPAAFVPPPVPGDSFYEITGYDAAGRLDGVSGPGERDVSITYDDAGRPSQVVFDRGQLDAQYDPATGQLASISAPDGVTTNFSYVGQLRSYIAWSGTVTGDVRVDYDARSHVVGESINGGATVLSTYDAAGLMTGIGSVAIERDAVSGLETEAALGVVRVSSQYDANGRLTTATAAVSGVPVLALVYERDVMGRITRVTETSGSGTHATGYSYDAAGRLAGVTLDGALIERSAFDAAGNRISVTMTGSPVAGAYDARNRLLDWAGTTYAYEPDGTLARRTSGGSLTTYDFDDLGGLRSVAFGNGRRIDYILDWSGRPIGRKVDGGLTAGYLHRPDGLIVAELEGSGALVSRFAYDDRDRLVSIEREGKSFMVLTDQLGGPRLVIDTVTGEVVEAITYDSWGRVFSDSNPGFQPFGFAGGLLDPDTGLVHFGAREYDPAIGRWIEPDPLRFASGEANLYSYAGNDPVNRSDPTGLSGDEGGGDWWYYIPPGGGRPQLCNGSGQCWNAPPGTFPDPAGKQPPGGDPGSPGPTDPGKGGGGFTCLGICFPPGGGLCVGLCSSGDPHVRTADRLSISFQGAGEYLMARSADGSVVIQVRQEPPFGMTEVTIATAVAASVAGDRVGVYLGDDGALSLAVNGAAVDGMDVARALVHGGSVTRHGTSFLIEWPDGSRLRIDQRGIHLDYGFIPDPSIAQTITGLMGTPDGDSGNDLVSRDGSLTLDPNAADFFTQLHGAFGDSWRISQDESLFDYGPGESTATFARPDIPTAPAATTSLDSDARAAAEELCRAVGIAREPTLTDCIVDVGFTGDSSYASSAAAVEAATAVAPPAPGVTQPIAMGATVAGTIIAAEQIDRYAFAGSVGEVVYLDAFGPCVRDLAWDLLGPAGEHLFSGLICNDLGPWTIQTDGSYTIEVYSREAATGFYAFQLRAGR